MSFISILVIASFASCLYLAGLVSVRIMRASGHSFDRWCISNLEHGIKNIEALLFFLLVLVFVGLPSLPFWGIVFVVRTIRGYIALSKSNNSPQELDQLAKRKSAFVRRAVIQNPNTSPETLLKLGKDFPRELLQNPVFPLMLLSDPNLLQTMPRDTLASLLKLDDIPIGYLEQAAAIPNLGTNLARIIAKHPKASSQALQQIAAYSHDLEIGQIILRRSDGMIAIWEALARYGHQNIQLCLAKSNPPQTVLNNLANCGHEAVQLYLAQQPTTSTEILGRLAQRFSQNAELARAIVQHPNISDAALQQLAKRSYILEVGQALLERRGLSAAVLEDLARYGHQEIQLRLIKRSDLPKSVFENLVEYGHDQVRLYLAQQPNTSVEVLERLAQKGDATQLYLAQQTQLSESVLKVLAQSGKANVRLYLAQHHSLPHDSLEFLVKREPAVQFYLAQQPDLSPDLLKLLAIHGNSAVQQLLLQRSDLTSAVLVRLAKCSHPDVQLLVEQKLAVLEPETEDAVLLTLAEHGGKRIQLFLFNRLQIYNQPELLLNKLIEQGHRKVKLYIAQQPNTPVEALEKLSTDTRAAVRRFVALNPSTPLTLLKQLTADSDPQVSQTALQKLSERGE